MLLFEYLELIPIVVESKKCCIRLSEKNLLVYIVADLSTFDFESVLVVEQELDDSFETLVRNHRTEGFLEILRHLHVRKLQLNIVYAAVD